MVLFLLVSLLNTLKLFSLNPESFYLILNSEKEIWTFSLYSYLEPRFDDSKGLFYIPSL